MDEGVVERSEKALNEWLVVGVARTSIFADHTQIHQSIDYRMGMKFSPVVHEQAFGPTVARPFQK
jgi:hypothetical protein